MTVEQTSIPTAWRRPLLAFLFLGLLSLYLSYTFNSCLVSSLIRRTTPMIPHQSPYISKGVRVVPLFTNVSETKYRSVRQRGARRLPTALIIGIKKAGTRALLEFLRIHPDIRAAGCEVHFFDRYYDQGLEWYRKKMPPTVLGQITMEKTPAYWVSKDAPARIAKMNPGTKLLVVVRDPVTRALSDYAQASSKRPGMPSFEQLAFLNGTNGGIVDTRWGPVRLGVYARYLLRWLKYFSLSQMLFISGERLVVDPAAEVGRVQDFLGLKRLVTEKHFYFNTTKGFPCLFKSETKSSPHCLGKTKGRSHPRVPVSALIRLREFYRPFNQHFYQLTGINFGWP
ncbi:heparan sulfate glucosamine 3-O-sulfotransferase 6 [Chrysoperla carnea]|uniref:heparan sulfate glucosamine 3-O-sulfotransferase 6 n=1 Tax=Chrysoperla carnea TaxID=189513 RepID=UPI001D07C429|nr:heparan sulfate glucosamine 3-O-sulfotransferase 6 [Chrysoperla carnea]